MNINLLLLFNKDSSSISILGALFCILCLKYFIHLLYLFWTNQHSTCTWLGSSIDIDIYIYNCHFCWNGETEKNRVLRSHILSALRAAGRPCNALHSGVARRHRRLLANTPHYLRPRSNYLRVDPLMTFQGHQWLGIFFLPQNLGFAFFVASKLWILQLMTNK